MKQILFCAFGALLALVFVSSAAPTRAEGITRVCDLVVSPSGANNCPETFLSSPQVGLSTTVERVKATGGIVTLVHCWNPNSTQIYVQLFNAIPANVTLGTTKPVAFVPIAATSTGGWSISPLALGGFPIAISAAATTTAEGATAPATAPDCDIYFN